MSKKKRRPVGFNRQQSRVYGTRDRECPRCRVLLCSRDFTGAGICAWCEYDLDQGKRAIAALQARISAGNTTSGIEAPAPSRTTM